MNKITVIISLLCAIIINALFVSAYAEPIVLYDSGRTESITSYLEDLDVEPAQEVRVAPPTARTPNMKVGRVTPRRVKLPFLAMPIFLIGTDKASLNWLIANKNTLKEMGAVGMIINTKSESDTIKALKIGEGLQMSPASASGLAKLYKLKHYPVIVTKTEIYQ